MTKRFSYGGYKDEQQWPEIIEATVEAMVRLEDAMRPHIEGLDVDALR